MTALEWVQRSKIIAIVRGLPKEYMTRLAEALYAGGIDLMEVTFHQQKPETWKDTAAAIAAVDSCMEGKMLVGAGTVLTLEQLDMARDAGANYIITPNTNCDLIRRVKEYGLLSFPGAFTPSEIVEAYEAGADAVKVFPVGNLGPSYIKAIKAPLSHIPLMAVGGVNQPLALGQHRIICHDGKVQHHLVYLAVAVAAHAEDAVPALVQHRQHLFGGVAFGQVVAGAVVQNITQQK